jgi:hypothetical protein
MWRAATAVAERHGGGTSCRVPLVIQRSQIVRTTPAVAYGHGFPSLSKEGSSVAVMDPDNVAQPQ